MVIIRIRTAIGNTYRVNINDISNSFEDLINQWKQLLWKPDDQQLYKDETNWFWSFTENHIDKRKYEEIKNLSLRELGLHHGDIIYVSTSGHDNYFQVGDQKAKRFEMTTKNSDLALKGFSSSEVNELDSVDGYLAKMDGSIYRRFDPLLCRHSSDWKMMCDACCPLEPFDKSYYTKNKIKHLSFHSYLRMLARDLGKKAIPYENRFPLLSEPNYGQIRMNCKNHEPYPKGICSQCQPSPITLKVQEYRMVDHVEFEDPQGLMVENLLEGWRNTGYQVFGFLIGHYEPYTGNENVPPLAIKAVVQGILQPLQDNAKDGFELLHESTDLGQALTKIQDKIISALGLTRIGMIYTDLLTVTANSSDMNSTSSSAAVQYIRSPDTFFVSCYEASFMADLQCKHRYLCPWAGKDTDSKPPSLFNSRFVTIIVTGDSQGQISLYGYQLSLMGMRLFELGLISPSTKPSLCYVNKANDISTSPEIFYSAKDTQTGTERVMKANPTFPVDYLLVTLSHGFRQADPSDLPQSLPNISENIANTDSLISDSLFSSYAKFPMNQAFLRANGICLSSSFLSSLSSYIGNPSDLLTNIHQAMLAFTDLGFLTALIATELFSDSDFVQLKLILYSKDLSVLRVFLESNNSWKTLLTLIQESTVPRNVNDSSMATVWTCRHCTFLNTSSSSAVNREKSCEICGLPAD